jgi:mono/diheme cytochrome c family protein
MKKSLVIFVTILIMGAVVLTSCGGSQSTPTVAAGDEPDVVPAPYAGKTNPMANNADAAAKGKLIYDANCASCHGDTGKGDGSAGASLNPKPADLKDTKEDPDALVYYRIAEGGMKPPHNSAMPAWKDQLKEEEMWQLVTYIRSLP